MYLYFEDRNGKFRYVGECEEETVGKKINDFVRDLNPNYKIYYVRSWPEDGGITYDVGSHVEFFHAYPGMLADRKLF